MTYVLPTLLDVKKGVASQLGKTDWATPDAIRDTKINDAIREVRSSNRWNFAKTTAKLTFSASGVSDYTNGYGLAPWPADFSYGDDPYRILTYQTPPSDPLEWQEIDLEELPSYAVNDGSYYVYAVDTQNQQFVSNQLALTPTLSYESFPADFATDGSQDASPVLMSKGAVTATILLATANYWLASERDETEYDRFYRRYQQQARLAAAEDSRVGPPISIRNANYGKNLGFNRYR